VCSYFGYECQHWNEYPPDIQSQIIAAAKQIDANLQAQYATIRNDGGCDANVSGRLAGALKEKLIKSGGDPAKMSADDSSFGPKECAEWWRIYDRGVTMDDVLAVSTAVLGGVKASVQTICQNKITLPTCVKPPPPPPPGGGSSSGGGGGGVILPLPMPAKPKVSYANLLVTGGVVAAVSVTGYFVAKKKGWLK
jgi:hypothetical protein